MLLTMPNYNNVVKKIARFNKRLDKKHMPLITYNAVPKTAKVVDVFPHKRGKVPSYWEIEVMDFNFTSDFDTFQIETGYSIVGYIDHIENIVTPFCDIDLEYFRNRNICDHCGTNRRRNKTIILQKNDGTLYQVGTTCLSDFLSIDVNDFVKSIDFMTDDMTKDNDYAHVNSVRPMIDLETAVAHAYCNIKKYGFIPSSKGASSTRYALIEELFNLNKEFAVDVSEDDKHMAATIIDYMLSLSHNSSFNNNIIQIAQNKNVSFSTIGFIPAAVNGYLNYIEKKKSNAVAENDYVGNVGEKIEENVTVRNIYSYDANFNGKTVWISIFTFMNAKGNTFVWKTSTDCDIERGTSCTIKGSVKEHAEYKGTKQTVLTRVKIIK